MRGLSPEFIAELRTGYLSGLVAKVRDDKDLDLHIRENYLNIYFKGNSLLKLSEVKGKPYRVEVHEKFRGEHLPLAAIGDEAEAAAFVAAVPRLKAAIVEHGASSLEVEYEQLLIRANNLEPRTNSEYFIVDRQYAVGGDRFDLIGLWWPLQGRRRGQEVAPCFLELKYALNSDIGKVAQQLRRYHDAVTQRGEGIAKEIQGLWDQRLQLGLFNQTPDRLEAMATLRVTLDTEKFQYVVVLIDYNPHSGLFEQARRELAEVRFADRVRLFHTGFAMWQADQPPGFYVNPVTPAAL